MGKRRALIIGSPWSGAGKTTITLGLMGALTRKGFVIQPFKAGPDYIDSSYHEKVCKKPSYNLDSWMMGEDGVVHCFLDHMEGIDLGIIEGVMGIYDGKDVTDETGSTAHLAKVLGIPVILVIDARGMARSISALVKGFKEFDPAVMIKGIIFNRIKTERHFELLKGAIEKYTPVDVLGFLPEDRSLVLPERHLGLVMPQSFSEMGDFDSYMDSLTKMIEENIDLERLVDISTLEELPLKGKNKTLSLRGDFTSESHSSLSYNIPVKIGIALDEAFCFYYKENFEILKSLGADLVFFSPLRDRELPGEIQGLYIGGGYPELYASSLMENISMRKSIKECIERGMPVYAECGGLMYLGKEMVDIENKKYEMVGIFPWITRMENHYTALGYREVLIKGRCPFIKKGQGLRGHEFHYSSIKLTGPVDCTYMVRKAKIEYGEGYLYKNTLASYIHLHFRSNPSFAQGFVEKAREYGQV